MAIISHWVQTQCMITLYIHSRCLHTHKLFTLARIQKFKIEFTIIWTLPHFGFCYIPAVIVVVDGGRALLAKVGVVVLDPEDTRGKRNEPRETGASTSHCSERDNSPGNSLIVFNEHGWLRACFGEKEGAGNCENSENARLICKGNEVDIKHGYCLPLNLPSLISLDALF